MAEIIKDKYIVIKIEDAEKYLDDFEAHQLELALKSISEGREADGKKLNTYLVCNEDEPYSGKVKQDILDGEDEKTTIEECQYCKYQEPATSTHVFCEKTGKYAPIKGTCGVFRK